MAWRTYGNGQYYYRQVRDGDSVRSEYVGTGALGAQAAAADEAERMRRKAQQELYRRMVKADNEIAKQVNEICGIVRDLTKLVLIVDGYHQHKRQWRKDSMAEETTVLRLGATADDMGMTVQQLNALLQRIDTGKPTTADREALAKCLHAVPAFAALLGDMSARVVEHMLDKTNTQPSTRQAAGVHFINMRDDLGWGEGSAIEKSLILHIVVCWHRMQYVEQQFNLHTLGQHAMKEGAYWDRRLSSAQRRYLRAVESLERVRRMMRPDSPTMAVLMQQNVTV